MIYVKGDLLETNCFVIAHVVNCMGVMGAGVAAQIKKRWPRVYRHYTKYCDTIEHSIGRRSLMGKALGVYAEDGDCLVIFNLFAQYDFGTDSRRLRYTALSQSILNMVSELRQTTVTGTIRIAIPYKMGCGLAGGDWTFVLALLKEIEEAEDVEFVIYKLED